MNSNSNVPPRQTPGSVVSMPRTTVPGLVAKVLPYTGQQRAVIWSVSPNTTNPTSASVIIGGELPPRPGFTLQAKTGPWFLPGAKGADGVTPAPGPFYSDPITRAGGSNCIVDVTTGVVVTILATTDPAAPTENTAQQIGNHVHTGGTDEFGRPMPFHIDQTQLLTGAGGVTPNVSNIGAPTVAGSGNGTVDVSITFTLDSVGTSASLWLKEVQYVVAPVGTLTSQPQLWYMAGEQMPQATTTYTGTWFSLGAGNVFDIGLRYKDTKGIYSNVVVLAANETISPLGITSFPKGTNGVYTITATTPVILNAGSSNPTVTGTFTITEALVPDMATWSYGYRVWARVHSSASATDPTTYPSVRTLFSAGFGNHSTLPYDIQISPNKSYDLAIQIVDAQANAYPTATYVPLWSNISVAGIGASAAANSSYIGLYPPNTNLLFNPRFLNGGNGWLETLPTGGSIGFNDNTLQRAVLTASNISNGAAVVLTQYFPITLSANIPFIFSIDVQPNSENGGVWVIDMYNMTSPSTPTSQFAQVGVTATVGLGTTGRISCAGTSSTGLTGIWVRVYFLAQSSTNSATMYVYRPMLEVGTSGIPSAWTDGTGANVAQVTNSVPDGDGSYLLTHIVHPQHLGSNLMDPATTRFLLGVHAPAVTSVITDNGSGQGLISSSTALNAQASIPPFTTDFTLHTSVSGTSPNISMKYWLDNGTASTNVTFWRVNGTTLSASYSGTSGSPIGTITGLSSGDTVYFLAYYPLAGPWTVSHSTNTQFTPAQIAVALGDGIVPAIASSTINSIGASGGGNLKGCPEITEPIECRRDESIITVPAGALKVGDELRDFEPNTWNTITHFTVGPAPIWEVWFLEKSRPVKVDSSHLFMISDECWINIQNLKPGVKIARGGGGELTVVSSNFIGNGSIAHITCERNRYLFEETSSHNFKYY